jgi:benzoate-CoA ligase family protein
MFEQLPARWSAPEWFIGRHAASDAIALVTDDQVTTYRELDEHVRRFATALAGAGVRRGERVVIVLPDTPLHVCAFWGTLALGAIAVPLNPLLRPKDLAAILEDCDPRLTIGVEGGWSVGETMARVAAAAPGEYHRTHRDGFSFMLYSSGTTGEPKGVVHHVHDPWVSARTYGDTVLGLTARDRCFSVAKLFFAYGLGNAGYFPFHAGASSVLYAGRPTPEAIFDQVRRHRPTVFFAVPTSYAQMLAALDGGLEADLSSVHTCVSAGEALPASIFERWKARTGLEILDGLGSTEACHIFLSGRRGACRPGSTGLPVRGYELRIVDERGADVGPGEIGDLLVRGDSTMALYWNKTGATRRALAGEWLRTGDKYSRDADGYFFHAGRSDDMLKCRGQWVSPVEVEAALVAHPAVLECAVVGHVDGDGLTKPHALVVLRAEVSAAASLSDELVAFARERLSPHKAPAWVSFVPELPRTATGKLQRFLLRGASPRAEG